MGKEGFVYTWDQMTTSSPICRYWLLPLLLLMLLCIACNASVGLDIISHQLTTRQFTGDLNTTQSAAIVSGVARNSSNAPVSGPVIEVTFYDAKKNIIGSASAYREYLEPGETWNFSTQLISPDAWKVRDYRITGWAK